jgi:hypothetical protein
MQRVSSGHTASLFLPGSTFEVTESLPGNLLVAEDALALLRRHPSVRANLPTAWKRISEYFPEGILGEVRVFSDPYDGSQALVVKLESMRPYAEASGLIDDFCSNWWYRYVDGLPVNVVFQAG